MDTVWLKLEIAKREAESKELQRKLDSFYMNKAKLLQAIDETDRQLVGKLAELKVLREVIEQGETDG